MNSIEEFCSRALVKVVLKIVLSICGARLGGAAQGASMAAGLAGLLYVLVGGVWRLRRAFGRRQGGGARNALALPLATTLALLLPVPFFLTQSFLELGDRTAASLLLMAVTAALAPAMAWGLWRAALLRHCRVVYAHLRGLRGLREKRQARRYCCCGGGRG
eukprot:gene28228-35050_t